MNEKMVCNRYRKAYIGVWPMDDREIGLLVERTTWKTPGTANSLKQTEPGNILFPNLQETLEPGVE